VRVRVLVTGAGGFDTSIDARATSAALGVPLPSVRELLELFRAEWAAR